MGISLRQNNTWTPTIGKMIALNPSNQPKMAIVLHTLEVQVGFRVPCFGVCSKFMFGGLPQSKYGMGLEFMGKMDVFCVLMSLPISG